MFDIRQLFLSLLSPLVFQHVNLNTSPQLAHPPSRSVAVVGAGSAGLAMLLALVDLQDELGDSPLDIVMYEQRRNVGGVWLPDPDPSNPPVLPETPLYPLLHTTVPIPFMTFPGLPFPPGTPLFPSHEHVERYHQDFASQYNLWPYILLNHTVQSANWVGTPEQGRWNVVVSDQDGHETRRWFDHLVVANGHNHYPRVPTFPGLDEWLRQKNGPNGRQREILHSIYYREPKRYANQTVVVVGGGWSGQDIASHVSLYAQKVYLSVRHLRFQPPDMAELKPETSHFTPDAIVFADGPHAYNVDTVILATGYDLRVPLLEATDEVAVKPKSNERDRGLTTNLRYIFPLHQHIFSLASSYPINALAFIGLPVGTFSCLTDFAQSIYAARVIINGTCIGPREALLEELDTREDDLRSMGYDPYYVGHRMLAESQFDYQEHPIDKPKDQGIIPDDGEKYVRPWRRESYDYACLRRGWQRVEKLGLQKEWLKGVETEEEWVEMMKRLNAWQKEWEVRQGLAFPEELTLF